MGNHKKRTSGYFFLLVTKRDSMIIYFYMPPRHKTTKSHNARLEMLRVDTILPVSHGFNLRDKIHYKCKSYHIEM